MSWSGNTHYVKRFFSTLSKIILRDRPIQPIVTKSVDTIKLDTNLYPNLYNNIGNNGKDSVLYGVLLDGRLLHTPKGNVFNLSSEKLLALLVKEWTAMKGKLHRFRMLPITYCISSHIDCRQVANAKLLGYFEHDTLKYLPFLEGGSADPSIPWSSGFYPLGLEFLKQLSEYSFEECSTALLSQYLSILSLKTTSLTDVTKYIDTLTSFCRIVMEMLSDEYKSFILASSVFRGAIAPEVALRLSRIEETYQKSMSIKNVDNVESNDNVMHWIRYWQEEEAEILDFVSGILSCSSNFANKL